MFGGIAFGLLGARTSTKIGRDPIVILGFVIHIIAFFLIFLNLPNVANLGDTKDIGEYRVTHAIYVAIYTHTIAKLFLIKFL